MDTTAGQRSLQFAQPISQIITMLVVLGLVLAGSYLAFPYVGPTFLANPILNAVILFVFVIGVGTCFLQVFSLIRSVRWIEAFAGEVDSPIIHQAPQLLAPLAALLRSRGARMQINSSSSRSILDSVAQRIDELREISRYITSTLIFLGLLGTFYGLATTVPALVQTIQSLTPKDGEAALDIFNRLQKGLEGQLDGMGIAFASSLLGLASSLVVGLLELFAGQAQNRFYRELEEWLSTITRVGFAAGDGEGSGDAGIVGTAMDHMATQMSMLAQMFEHAEAGRLETDARLLDLSQTIGRLTAKLDTGQTEALERVAASQEQIVARMQGDSGDGIDAESRMRLRSIDVQLLRILEEMSAGRQESIAEVRNEMNTLASAIRASMRDTSS